MEKMIIEKCYYLTILLVLSLCITVSCGKNSEESSAQVPVKDEVLQTELDGQSLLNDRCSRCHNLSRVDDAKKSKEEWTVTVDRMIGKGAVLDDNEREVLIIFLAKTHKG